MLFEDICKMNDADIWSY